MYSGCDNNSVAKQEEIAMTAYKIDHTKGQCIGTVSEQWFTRTDDQRFLSLGDVHAQTLDWANASEARDVKVSDLRAHATPEGGLMLAGLRDEPMNPTNFAFGEIAGIAKAPASYLRKLPASIAADCLNAGFEAEAKREDKAIQAYLMGVKDEADVLRAVTSTKYGRIHDHSVVAEVMKLAGQGTGDTRWKVPGTIDWGSEHGVSYNPNVDITKDNTTLYASDRDLFLFLVDDMNPIEVGKLANGDPDLMFRGFYTWNSEVGDKTFGIATMYLRGVCMNRNLWGVEGFQETTFRHTAGAPGRFMLDAAPALQSYAEAGTKKLVAGVAAAKAAVVTGGDGDEAGAKRLGFLKTLGFSTKRAQDLVLTSIVEEGRPPESVWDYAQAITAQARSETHQDARVKMEGIAGRLLNKVAVEA
jgi:hypothetical protein